MADAVNEKFELPEGVPSNQGVCKHCATLQHWQWPFLAYNSVRRSALRLGIDL